MLDGPGWRVCNRPQDFQRQAGEREDVAGRVVEAIWVAIFAEGDVLVPVHDLEAPLGAVNLQERF